MPLEFAAPSKGAQYMRSLGFYVFPLAPNSKVPPKGSKWQEESLTFEDGTISSYVMGHGNEESNFGVHPPEGLFVVDIDNKGDKKGSDTWAELQGKHGTVPRTLTVQTPTGGLHKYFRGPGRNSVGALGRGLDTRAHGGYVVAPGSIINNKQYEIIDNSDVADAPEWLISAMAKVAAPVKEVKTAIPTDLPHNVETAIEYLQDAEAAIEGVNGDTMLFQIFAKLKDLGISPEQSKELVLEHYNDRCDPPWDMDNEDDATHFDQKLAQGWKTKNSPGSHTPEARVASATEDFASVPLPEPTKTNEKPITPLPLKSAGSIVGTAIPKRDWIIDGFLLGSFLSITGAPGGTGKSNFEILKAFAVVTGRNLLGERNPVVRRGAVVLYNCEDPLDEMERRVEAVRLDLKLTTEEIKDLYLVSGRDHSLTVASVDRSGEVVLHEKSIARLVATVASVNAVMLSVDPLVRTHHLNENDNMAMDKVTQAFQRISSATGCSVSVVHHTNKAALNTSDSRDSSSQAVFRGAGSLVASARVGHVLTTMSTDEAKRMAIPPEKRRYYFKVESAKANLSAPAELADWYRADAVEIPNGEKIGICRRVDLMAQADVMNAQRFETQKEECLEFLRHNIGDDMKPVTELKNLASLGGCTFAEVNSTRFLGKLQELLFGELEFTVEQSNTRGKPWVVSRGIF